MASTAVRGPPLSLPSYRYPGHRNSSPAQKKVWTTPLFFSGSQYEQELHLLIYKRNALEILSYVYRSHKTPTPKEQLSCNKLSPDDCIGIIRTCSELAHGIGLYWGRLPVNMGQNLFSPRNCKLERAFTRGSRLPIRYRYPKTCLFLF